MPNKYTPPNYVSEFKTMGCTLNGTSFAVSIRIHGAPPTHTQIRDVVRAFDRIEGIEELAITMLGPDNADF